MKLIMENWRKFVNESKNKKTGTINTKRGTEEVEISYELGNFFIYKTKKKSKSYYHVTHKPSGNMVPFRYYSQSYGSRYADIKRMLNDIDKMLDSEELSKEKPSDEALKSLVNLISGKNSINEVTSQKTADALKKFSDASKETASSVADSVSKQKAAMDAATKSSDSFKKFADTIGAFSDSLGDDAKESEKVMDLYQKFEDAKLGEFIDKIGELAPLADMMDSIDDGKGAGEIIAGLQDLDMDPKEIGEKLQMVQDLRDEFDEYKKEQETAQKEREDAQTQKDQEQDAAMKDAAREATDGDNAAKAQEQT